jgi:lambda repressor-like predicted transcriptional regulator
MPNKPGQGRKTKLNDEVANRIVAALQSGAFLHVAAEAAGISRNTLLAWLKSPDPKYKDFQERVRQAIAIARLQAEINVYKDDPKFWLRCGPGRERHDHEGNLMEGWTETPQPTKESKTNVNILMSPEWQILQQIILDALADNPEARTKILDRLMDVQSRTSPTLLTN